MNLVSLHPIHLRVEFHMPITEDDVSTSLVAIGNPIISFSKVARDVTIVRAGFHDISNRDHVAGRHYFRLANSISYVLQPQVSRVSAYRVIASVPHSQ